MERLMPPRSGRPTFYKEESVELAVASDGLDFMKGDGLLQDFDLTSSQLASFREHDRHAQRQIVQYWSDSVSEFIGGTIKFALTKFRAKPGRCTP
jgi:hypothetical protein